MEKYILESQNKDTFIDMSSLFPMCTRFSRVLLFGPHHAGKSTFLSGTRCFFDRQLDSKKLFENCVLFEEDPHMKHRLNSVAVIHLDFSDFNATNKEDAMKYFQMKISELYFSFADEILWPRYYGEKYYFDILEQKVTGESLFKALQYLCVDLKNGDQHIDQPLVLVDEITKPIRVSNHYGYSLYDYKQMFDFDIYDYALGVVGTGFGPYDNTRRMSYYNSFNVYYTSDLKSFQKIPCSNQDICPPLPTYHFEIDEATKQRVKDCREQLHIAAIQRREEEIRFRQRRTNEYAEPLIKGVELASKHIGDRAYDIPKDSKVCKRLENVLTYLYKHKDEYHSFSDLYERMNGYRRKKTNWQDIDQTICEVDGWEWNRFNDTSGYWLMISPRRQDCTYSHNLIKIFVSPKNRANVKEIFEPCTKWLFENAHQRFAAKASQQIRNDAICFWVVREDFFSFEKILMQFEEKLCKPLSFVPYRNKFGISIELFDQSYNASIAEMIFNYFKTVNEVSEISLNAMINGYVRDWNTYGSEYSGKDAEQLVTILESFDVLFGRKKIDDNHLFLQDDKVLWKVLEHCECWHDYNQYLENPENKLWWIRN